MEYSLPASQLHLHTRREWRGVRQQYAIALPYDFADTQEGSPYHAVFRQQMYNDTWAVTVDDEDLNRFIDITVGLMEDWRRAEKEEKATVDRMLKDLQVRR